LTFAPNAPGAWEGSSAISDDPLTGGPGTNRARDCCAVAARAASAKLARDIIVLDVAKVLGLTDAFVISSGTNPRQVRTICDEIERQLKSAGAGRPLFSEGLDDARWALLDYGDFVVHVFLDEARLFYDLERLWGDAPRWSWDESAETLVGAPA
jgi:ribosome-associated protein